MEPRLPIAPAFEPSLTNPCIKISTGQLICLPFIHLISGWHMFSDEALGFLKRLKEVEVRGGTGCFDDWEPDAGSARWVESFGGAPSTDRLIMTHCNKLLQWYPAFAGRYTSSWGKSYGPCKAENVAKPGDYYSLYMWPICRPRALVAHDAAMGTGGAGQEATPPFVMKALYSSRVRVVSALRHPVDRLETAFWLHGHYARKYGANAAGLQAYLHEQFGAFRHCEATHGTRRCAHLFELLGLEQSDVFFHCDQIIRSLYHPFLEDWHKALGDTGLLVIKVDDLLDRPDVARPKLARFLGLPPGAVSGTAAPSIGYAALHAASLKSANAQPMLTQTRVLAEEFYRTDLERVARLFPSVTWPAGSTLVDAAGIAAAGKHTPTE